MIPTNRERVKLPSVSEAGFMAWSKVAVTVVVGATPVDPSAGVWPVTIGAATAVVGIADITKMKVIIRERTLRTVSIRYLLMLGDSQNYNQLPMSRNGAQ